MLYLIFVIFVIFLILFIIYKFKRKQPRYDIIIENDLEKNLESNDYYINSFQNLDFDKKHYNHSEHIYALQSVGYENYNSRYSNYNDLIEMYKKTSNNFSYIRKRGRAGSPIKNEK